jgi:hypothetical protein
MRLFGVFGDAVRLYLLLWRHSLPAAALAQGVLWLVDSALLEAEGDLEVLLGSLWFVLALAAPMLVQGMLIVLVEDVHEGRRATETRAVASIALRRLPSLVGASILYFFGVALGLLLLIVPGLIAAARWCLMTPLIVLENRDVGESRAASSGLVSGKTGRVLIVVALLAALEYGLPEYARTRLDSGAGAELAYYGLLVLATPYVAHVLSALYYRLADPLRPVIAERHGRLGSAWDEHALEDARRLAER